jgi:hypothetical protein
MYYNITNTFFAKFDGLNALNQEKPFCFSYSISTLQLHYTMQTMLLGPCGKKWYSYFFFKEKKKRLCLKVHTIKLPLPTIFDIKQYKEVQI